MGRTRRPSFGHAPPGAWPNVTRTALPVSSAGARSIGDRVLLSPARNAVPRDVDVTRTVNGGESTAPDRHGVARDREGVDVMDLQGRRPLSDGGAVAGDLDSLRP